MKLDSVLQRRGILESSKAAGWQEQQYKHSAGWAYPVIDYTTGDVIAQRWKAAPGQSGMKYGWIPGKPDTSAANWYITKGTAEAVAAADGVAYLANGEPALLAYQAAGIDNVIATTLSEVAVPVDAIDALRAMGIHRLIYPIDNDGAGTKSGANWRDALSGTGIDVEVLSWGDDAPDKADANDIWITCHFNRDDFQTRLAGLMAADLPAPVQKETPDFDPDAFEGTPAGLIDAIAAALQVKRWKSNGWSVNVSSPYHEDKKPSFGINKDSGVGRDFATGENYSPTQIAERLGIDWRRFYPDGKPAVKADLHKQSVSEDLLKKATSELGIDSRYMKVLRQHNLMTVQSVLDLGHYEMSQLRGIGDKCIENVVACFAMNGIELDWLKKTPISQWARDVKLNKFTSTKQVNMRYISNLNVIELGSTNVIRSPLGTGKTALIERMIGETDKFAPDAKVLVLTHLQVLAGNIANRLGIDVYSGIPHEYRGMAQRLVCSYDSIHTISDEWDLVFIDEHEQFHQHLNSGTMKGAAPARAYEKLKRIVRGAGRVVCLDAHMTDVSIKWLENVRGNVTAIENTYRHSWGDITLQEHDAAIVKRALEVATSDDNKGVVIVSNQKSTTVDLADYFRGQLGSDAVMLINGETSAASDVQQFIKKLTLEKNRGKPLNQIFDNVQVLICSPSMATGIDVQAQVSAVYGVFFRHNWLNVYKVLQMMMRYRQADERQLCLVGGGPDADPVARNAAEALQIDIKRAEETAKAAEFSRYNIETTTSTTRAIAKLNAMFGESVSQQHYDFFSYMVAGLIDEGFQVQYGDKDYPHVTEAIIETRSIRADVTRDKTLKADPIDPDELEKRSGQMTSAELEEASYGVLRWKIEQLTCKPITEESYDLFHNPRSRADFRRLINQLQPVEELKLFDRHEAAESVLLSKRKHVTRNRDLIAGAIAAVFGDKWLLGSTSQLTESEIRERMTAYLDEHLEEIRTYIDHRWKECSNEEINILRRLLKRIGLKLERKQLMRDGERFYVYWINETHRNLLLDYARHALKKRAENSDYFIHGKPLKDSNTNEVMPDDMPDGNFSGVMFTSSSGERIPIPF